MNSQAYLEALGAALRGLVPDRERLNALRYYKEYFEAEGPEREQAIIDELGDPEELAAKIAREHGFAPQHETAPQSEEPPQSARKRPQWLIVVSACVGALLVAGVAIGIGILSGKVVRNVAGVVKDAVVEIQNAPDVPQAPGAPSVIDAHVSDGFSKIEMDIGIGNVTVRAGDRYDLAIDVASGMTGYDIRYEMQSDGTLRLTSMPKSADKGWKLGETLKAEVVFTVPEDCVLSEVEIEVGVGSVRLDGLSCKEIECSAGVGEVSAYDLGRVEELSLETGIGDVILRSVPAGDTDLKTGTGAIQVKALCAESECHYELETGLGEITVFGRKYSHGKAENQSGGAYNLEAETGMGEIEVSFQ